MAWPSISVNGLPLIFDLLVNQSQISGNSFSFYLTRVAGSDGSALVLGGVNDKYHTGSFRYYNLKMANYWAIELDDIVFNGTSYKVGNLLGIVDTGTSVIVGPTKVVENMTKAFGAGKEKQVDCSIVPTLPTLDFKIGGDVYSLKGKDYILEIDQGGKSICVVGIMGLDLPPQLGEAFIMGDAFIKAFYTHFDVQNKRVGFAPSIWFCKPNQS